MNHTATNDRRTGTRTTAPPHVARLLDASFSGEQRSEEWFATREKYLTSSDLGSVLGLNRYQSREDVLLKKAGIRQVVIDDYTAIDHGHRYESEAIEAYCALTGRTAYEIGLVAYETLNERTVVDGIDCSFLAGSADGVTVPRDDPHGDGLNAIEVKAPYRRWPKYNVIPEHYYPQLQMNLHILDLPHGDFIEYWPKGFQGPRAKMNIVRIYRDDRWFAHVVPELRAFWDEVCGLRDRARGEGKGEGEEDAGERGEEDGEDDDSFAEEPDADDNSMDTGEENAEWKPSGTKRIYMEDPVGIRRRSKRNATTI